MAYNDKIRASAALTGISRAVFETVYAQFPFAAYFPLVERPTRQFELTQVAPRSSAVASKLVGYNTTAPRGGGQAAAKVVHGRAARTSEARLVDEFNLISTPSAEQLGEWMDEKARSLGEVIANRLRLMAGEVLATGKIDMAEGNTSQIVDFNRPEANQVTLTGANLWADAASTPLENLKAWRTAAGGANHLFVSRATLDALQKNTDLIKRALQRGTDLLGDISDADVASVLSQYGFALHVLSDEDNVITAYDGTAKTVIPADHAFLLPPAGASVLGTSAVGETHLAPTVEAEQAHYGIPAGARSGVWCGAFHEDDPEGYSVRAAAEFMPLLKAPGAVVAAKVA